MKTCGTTTLLRCVATLLQAALEQQGLVLEWMGYSRKNFTFPGDQLFPHSSFDQELQYLRAHSHLNQRLNGAGSFCFTLSCISHQIRLGTPFAGHASSGTITFKRILIICVV